jgi:hypothetical protein
MNSASGREQRERGDPKIARRVLTCRKERRGKERYDVNRNRQEELGTGRVADRKWRNQVQEGTEMERTGNGTDMKEVDRKWMQKGARVDRKRVNMKRSGKVRSGQNMEWKERGIEVKCVGE